jgi:uncharacterized membrane protein YeaQ/YmgE (transglycosylase-associated protein family)
MKQAIWVGMVLGSFVGSFIPALWGAGVLSFSSIVLSAVGAMIGIYIAFKLTR